MSTLNVMTIVGTRPEIIRLCCTLQACDRHFRHVLVHTGQNWDYTLSEIFFKELGLRRPDHFLEVAGRHLGETIGNIISRAYDVMVAEKPDALLILGDTNSALAAIPAKRLKIPIFHMEAGNRCFDQNVPEEINRRLVDHISDINLPYTEHSRRYLLSEGIHGGSVFVTGSPLAEVLHTYREPIATSTVLQDLGLQPKRYLLLSAHREENLDIPANFRSLVAAINRVAEVFDMPVIYSTHPRSRKRLEAEGITLDSRVRSLEPFGFFDWNHLQQNACCVLSDSGTLSEESSLLGFPAVLIRTSTERPEVLDAGSIVIGGISPDTLPSAVRMAIDLAGSGWPVPADYRDLNVSDKVVRIIASYTALVNRHTWQKTS